MDRVQDDPRACCRENSSTQTHSFICKCIRWSASQVRRDTYLNHVSFRPQKPEKKAGVKGDLLVALVRT